MKFKLMAVLFFVAAMLIISPFQATNVFAQKPGKDKMANKPKPKPTGNQNKEVVELKSNKGSGTADDPNITTEELPNSMANRQNAPANKGGNSKGAAGCKVIFDNYTDFRIKLYVNGSYRGTVGGFDDAYLYVAPSSDTVVYARADFDDGSYLYWGPTNYDCRSNQYIYFKMNP